ncbi:MAG TPA: polysaccharide deacetylase family protein [Geobacteraceae bacterium]
MKTPSYVQSTADNALTVDVEDWFHVCGLDQEPQIPAGEWRVRHNTERLLAFFAEHRVEATFFVLGCVAEAIPGLVPAIAAAGHEVASHGYSHRLVSRLDPGEFREELRRTGDILERQAGQRPVGFRAPQWSLSAGMQWAFDILHDEGYAYDSSCTPLPLVGDQAAPRTPHRISVPGGTLWEIPPLVTPLPLCNLPTGGGWGLRFFPQRVIQKTVRALNGEGFPAVLFLHPRELDPSGPRLKLAPLKAFATYGPRTDVTKRLTPLLKQFRFRTLRAMVRQWESA